MYPEHSGAGEGNKGRKGKPRETALSLPREMKREERRGLVGSPPGSLLGKMYSRKRVLRGRGLLKKGWLRERRFRTPTLLKRQKEVAGFGNQTRRRTSR